MILEFLDNPKIIVKTKMSLFITELKKNPLRWALLKTSPEKNDYWARRYSVDLSGLRKKYPEIDWHRAVTEDAHQIVAWYQPKEEN